MTRWLEMRWSGAASAAPLTSHMRGPKTGPAHSSFALRLDAVRIAAAIRAAARIAAAGADGGRGHSFVLIAPPRNPTVRGVSGEGERISVSATRTLLS